MPTESLAELLRTLLGGIAFFIWLKWLWSRRDLYRFSWNFSTIWGMPLAGILPCIKAGPKDLLPVLGRIFDTSKYSICVWFGVRPFFVTAEPHIIESILTSPDLLNKAKTVYAPLTDTLSNGLVTSSAEIWQTHRRLLNPTFHNKVLLSFLGVFNKSKQILLREFQYLDDGQEHIISNLLQNTTIALSLETTMGMQVDSSDLKEHIKFVDKVKYITATTANLAMLSFIHLGWLSKFQFKYHRWTKELHAYLNSILEAKLHGSKNIADASHKQNVQNVQDHAAIKKNHKIFVDQVIEFYQRGQFLYNDIITESNTIVVSASETTANIIYSTILMLAMHPSVQEFLFEEISSVFPDKNFQFDYEHMEQLPYFDMVFNEVLRLAPPLPIIGRMAVKETQLSQDIILPKNMEILISIFHLHRRKDIWGPNANEFDPEHFHPEFVSRRHAYAFIPFSKGSRNCIGWRYALFFTKVALTGLVRNYRFKTEFKFEDLEFVEHMTLKYNVEPKIKIETR